MASKRILAESLYNLDRVYIIYIHGIYIYIMNIFDKLNRGNPREPPLMPPPPKKWPALPLDY